MSQERAGQPTSGQTTPPNLDDVECVIVTFNSARTIEACIRAATSSGLMNITVWDNSSEDSTVAVLRAKASGVTVMCSETNVGFSKAVNAALRQRPSGRHILLLNPDCMVEPSTVAHLMAALGANPDLGAVVPAMVYPDGRRGIAGGGAPSISKELVALTHVDRIIPLAVQRSIFRTLERFRPMRGIADYIASSTSDELRTLAWVSGFCMLVRGDAWRRAGGLDERFFLYFEDVALCRMLRRAGWRVALVGSTRAIHEESASLRPGTKGRHYRRGMWTYFANYGSPLQRRIGSWALGA